MGEQAELPAREDLCYRLDVFAIHVPPLRERRADLALLVKALLTQLSQKLGVAPPQVTPATLAKLETHSWPGNVRELMNVLEAALILGDRRSLELPQELAKRPSHDGRGSRFEGAVREAIEESLRETRGKIYGTDGAAVRLGLKPGTLQSKMKKLGIRRDQFC